MAVLAPNRWPCYVGCNVNFGSILLRDFHSQVYPSHSTMFYCQGCGLHLLKTHYYADLRTTDYCIICIIARRKNPKQPQYQIIAAAVIFAMSHPPWTCNLVHRGVCHQGIVGFLCIVFYPVRVMSWRSRTMFLASGACMKKIRNHLPRHTFLRQLWFRSLGSFEIGPMRLELFDVPRVTKRH